MVITFGSDHVSNSEIPNNPGSTPGMTCDRKFFFLGFEGGVGRQFQAGILDQNTYCISYRIKRSVSWSFVAGDTYTRNFLELLSKKPPTREGLPYTSAIKTCLGVMSCMVLSNSGGARNLVS